MHLPGTGFFLFLSIWLRPVYSQWGSLSQADRLCLFSFSHIQFQTQCHVSHTIRFPAFDFPPQRVKGYGRPALLGVGWGNSREPSSGCDTRPLLGGSSGSLFHMETMFVFTEHFRGKISPVWAGEAEYPYGIRLLLNMRQNNDNSSQGASILIDFLALMWHPVLLMNNCCPDGRIKSKLRINSDAFHIFHCYQMRLTFVSNPFTLFEMYFFLDYEFEKSFFT